MGCSLAPIQLWVWETQEIPIYVPLPPWNFRSPVRTTILLEPSTPSLSRMVQHHRSLTIHLPPQLSTLLMKAPVENLTVPIIPIPFRLPLPQQTPVPLPQQLWRPFMSQRHRNQKWKYRRSRFV